MSIVGFHNAGPKDQPSPSIWGDCPNTLLTDKGLGWYADATLGGAPFGTAGSGTVIDGVYRVGVIASTGSINRGAGDTGGAADFVTAAAINEGLGLYNEPMGQIILHSGRRFWFETIIALKGIGAEASGQFVGLVANAALSTPAAIVGNTRAVDDLVSQSLIGFHRHQTDADAWNAVYRKGAGAVVHVLDDVTMSTRLGDDASVIVSDAFWKLGLTFDGNETLRWFVNGVQVAAQIVDATVDQASTFGTIASVKSDSTAATGSMRLRRIRSAYQERF